MTYSMAVLEQLFQSLGLTVPKGPVSSLFSPKSAPQYVLATVLVVVVAIAEETIFRGYLLLRLRQIVGSSTVPVLLSAAIFSLGHGYEGTAGVATIAAMGIMLAVIYLWRKSLIAPIVMHFMQDFIGIIIVPLVFTK
jgi:membrane protease YdiL (CAAX protease family)